MADKKHRPLNPREIARLLIDAQQYRRRFVSHNQRFNPLSHIERELPFYYGRYCYDIVPEIIDEDGTQNDAQVTFDQGITLEISEKIYRSAHRTLTTTQLSLSEIDGSATFTLCHEIAHILLHYKKKNQELKTLQRGLPGTGTSFRTSPREEQEANVFGGGLQVPIDKVYPDTTVNALRMQYRVSHDVAIRIIRQKKQLSQLIEELRYAKRR